VVAEIIVECREQYNGTLLHLLITKLISACCLRGDTHGTQYIPQLVRQKQQQHRFCFCFSFTPLFQHVFHVHSSKRAVCHSAGHTVNARASRTSQQRAACGESVIDSGRLILYHHAP
jgi:hypothetical protein